MRGKWVIVRVRCPRRVERACRTTVLGKIGKRLSVTRRRGFRVGRGKVRLVALRVKARFRDRVRRRKRLLIVQRVRVGGELATFARSRVLIRRR
jgi:hypothetical protein